MALVRFMLIWGSPIGAQALNLSRPDLVDVLRGNDMGEAGKEAAAWSAGAVLGDWFDGPTWWVFAIADAPAASCIGAGEN